MLPINQDIDPKKAKQPIWLMEFEGQNSGYVILDKEGSIFYPYQSYNQLAKTLAQSINLSPGEQTIMIGINPKHQIFELLKKKYKTTIKDSKLIIKGN